MKKLCELCERVANVMCGSDEARLCWGCDWKVHGANFLVEKHLRVLLCHVCQAPTPWNGSGPKLVVTVAFCEKCVEKNRGNGKSSSSSSSSSCTLTLRRSEISEEGCGSSNNSPGSANHPHCLSDDGKENQVVPYLSFS